MKYWDYDYDGSLDDAIQKLIDRNKHITCVTILNYAESTNSAKQKIMFPIRALILYNN
jgi:hypothetical protein